MRVPAATALLLATAQTAELNLITDGDYIMTMKSWAWDGDITLEPTISKVSGNFADVGNGDPNVVMTLLITTDEIPEDQLATLDIENDDDEWTWFERVQFTWNMSLDIWMMVDWCKNDAIDDGFLFVGNECAWNWTGKAHNVYTEPASYKGVAHRREGGDVKNDMRPGTPYNVYSTYSIRDSDTGETFASGGPTVNEFIPMIDMDASAVAGLVLASSTILAGFFF